MTMEVFANLMVGVFLFCPFDSMACLRPQRLLDKVTDLMAALVKVQDQIQNSYTNGLVNGFDKPSIPQ